MSFSSGTYSLPGPALNTGDTVSATENNTFRNDVATAFNLTWLRNGTAAATADIPMGGFSFTNCAAVGSAGSLLLKTNGGTTAVTIDTSQNLGLGVTPSGSYQLQTQSNYTAGSKGFSLSSFSGGSSGNGVPFVGYNIVTTSTASSYKYNQTDVASAISFYDGVKFYVAPSGTAGNVISFTQAMTLDASGNLLVGTTNSSDTAGAGIKLRPSSSAPVIAQTFDTTSGGAGTYILYNVNATNNGYRFYVGSDGGIRNYSANNSNLSDERTKTDIQDAGSYLAKICSIPVRTFKYKDQTDDLLNLGVIAQEVEAVAPELVDMSGFGEMPEDGVPLKAIYQTDLQYALMKCIQEQQAMIASQSQLITQLQADVAALKGQA